MKKVYYEGLKIKKVNPDELKNKVVYKVLKNKYEYVCTLKKNVEIYRFIDLFGNYYIKSVNNSKIFIKE